MSVINQDDFLGRIDHQLGDNNRRELNMEEQRQIEAYQDLERLQAVHPANEWGTIDHKQYVANVRWLTLQRNVRLYNRSLTKASARSWKKILKRNVVVGELTEFLFEHLVGMTSEPAAAFHDELHAASSRFYIKDPALFQKEIALTNKTDSPTARFVVIQYVDRIGNTLPYQDWRLRITDGDRLTFIELPFSMDERVNEYIDKLCLQRDDFGWVMK